MKPRAAIAMIGLSLLIACDFDPLGLSKRSIVGKYVLERAENNYFLIDPQHQDTGGGVVEGVVINIGWDQRRILVWRHPIFNGDPDGLVIVDVATGKITRVTASEVSADATLSRIKMLPVADAWTMLDRDQPTSGNASP